MKQIYLFGVIVSIIILTTSNGLNCPDGYISTGTTCEECGLTSVTPNVKIAGGIAAMPNSWPAHALIIQSYKGIYGSYAITVQFTCAGTLVNAYTILTAARCISETFSYTINGNTTVANMYFVKNPYYSSLESTFKVYLGVHNKTLVTVNPTPPIVQYSVSSVIKHPLYNSTTYLNDVALLILNNSVTFNQYIQPACLPNDSLSYQNTTCYTAGWGTLYFGGVSPDVLYNVNLTIYNFSYCNSVVPSIPKNSSSQLCAGELAGGKGSCQGDAGGASYVLDTLGTKSRYIVVGITSYSDGCAQANLPSVYTRVGYFINWIKINWKEGPNLVTTTNNSTVTTATIAYPTSTTFTTTPLATTSSAKNAFTTTAITNSITYNTITTNILTLGFGSSTGLGASITSTTNSTHLETLTTGKLNYATTVTAIVLPILFVIFVCIPSIVVPLICKCKKKESKSVTDSSRQLSVNIPINYSREGNRSVNDIQLPPIHLLYNTYVNTTTSQTSEIQKPINPFSVQSIQSISNPSTISNNNIPNKTENTISESNTNQNTQNFDKPINQRQNSPKILKISELTRSLMPIKDQSSNDFSISNSQDKLLSKNHYHRKPNAIQMNTSVETLSAENSMNVSNNDGLETSYSTADNSIDRSRRKHKRHKRNKNKKPKTMDSFTEDLENINENDAANILKSHDEIIQSIEYALKNRTKQKTSGDSN